MVYWTFSEPVEGGNLTSVAKGRLADDEKTIENAQVIYRATPAYDGALHYGSRILFDETGNITDVQIANGIGAGCDEEALKAVRQAKFKPGKQRGKSVRVKMSLPITFRLK